MFRGHNGPLARGRIDVLRGAGNRKQMGGIFYFENGESTYKSLVGNIFENRGLRLERELNELPVL